MGGECDFALRKQRFCSMFDAPVVIAKERVFVEARKLS
jgi:hypothetical protein